MQGKNQEVAEDDLNNICLSSNTSALAGLNL